MKNLQLDRVFDLLSRNWQSAEDLRLTSGFSQGELSKRLTILKWRGLVERKTMSVCFNHVWYTQRSFWRKTEKQNVLLEQAKQQ